jgi:hypothetical protein
VISRGSRKMLQDYLEYPDVAAEDSAYMRERAIARFGIETVGPQWREFLG